MSTSNTSVVQTFSKGLQVLEIIVEKQTITVTELARQMGIPKSASYRFLNTLRLHGYITQTPSNNYVLSDRINKLGNHIVPKLEFHSIAINILNALTKNDTGIETVANLAMWDGSKIVYLAQSSHNPYALYREGSSVPAYCSALGKAILAYAPPNVLEKYLQNVQFEKFTDSTTSTKESLLKELASVREKNYATSFDELCIGLKGIAVPLKCKGFPVKYSISVNQTIYGSTENFIEKFYPLLVESAESIISYIDLGIYNVN